MSTPRFAVIAGGGTAGHTMPSLAIAQQLTPLGISADAIELWVSDRAVDAEALADCGFDRRAWPGRGLRRRISPSAVVDNLAALATVVRNLVLAGASLLRHRPRVVISVGGYVAFAPLVAATLLRIPIALVNVDAVASVVNRSFARWARVNFVAFASPGVPRVRVTGAPLRPGIGPQLRSPSARAQARRELSIPDGHQVVAVMSGSLGARSINDAVVGLAQRWSQRDDVTVIHITGRRDYDQVVEATTGLESATLDYRPVPFDPAMERIWSAADVALCRAGAMTVAELTAIGVPAVLVPLPNSPKDHQRRNAEEVASAGGALTVADDQLSTASLAALVEPLLAAPDRLESMAEASRAIGHGDAAAVIATAIVELAGG